MPILNCSVKPCNYNRDGMCCLRSIDVSGGMKSDNTCCASFSPSSSVSNSVCSSNPTKHTDIKCMAKDCNYNKALKCTAEKVAIRECADCRCTSCSDTKCDTFTNSSTK